MGSQLYSTVSIHTLILQVLLVSQVLQGHPVPQVLLALKVNKKMDGESLADWLGVNEHCSLPVSLVLHCSNQKSELMVLILDKIYFGGHT